MSRELLQQEATALHELDRRVRMFGAVAWPAKKLDILAAVRSAPRQRDHVIDFVSGQLGSACGASPLLQHVKLVHVFLRVAVSGANGSPGSGPSFIGRRVVSIASARTAPGPFRLRCVGGPCSLGSARPMGRIACSEALPEAGFALRLQAIRRPPIGVEVVFRRAAA